MTRVGPALDGMHKFRYLSLAKEPAMKTVTIHTAKTTLSQLLARVEAGEEIVLARGKQPIAKLVPFNPPVPKRRFGALKGIVTVDDSFFEPLTEAELGAWE
jgi:prevent-host-death family protein